MERDGEGLDVRRTQAVAGQAHDPFCRPRHRPARARVGPKSQRLPHPLGERFPGVERPGAPPTSPTTASRSATVFSCWDEWEYRREPRCPERDTTTWKQSSRTRAFRYGEASARWAAGLEPSTRGTRQKRSTSLCAAQPVPWRVDKKTTDSDHDQAPGRLSDASPSAPFSPQLPSFQCASRICCLSRFASFALLRR